MEPAKGKLRLLLVGVSPFVSEFVINETGADENRQIETTEVFLQFLDEPVGEGFHIAIVGSLLKEISIVEIAQSLRGVLGAAPIFFCHDSREQGFDRKDFKKNGFSDAFLLPIDKSDFKCELEKIAAEIKKRPAFRSVRVFDIQGDTNLDFDLHILLPSNKKYIRYATAGRVIAPDRVEKLKSHNVGSVFIPLEQMSNFYSYSASRLKALTGEGGGLSATEKKERLQVAVRELMSSIFTTGGEGGFEDGKEMMLNANEIVKSLLLKEETDNWYARVLKAVGEMNTSYNHLSNVSTFAAIFSMALGIGKVEDLAMAGLFHDVGLSLVPSEIQTKPEPEWTDADRAAFEKHPEHSVNLVKTRKLVMPESIHTMIMQHHERVNGTGYPNKLVEAKIKKESQLLGIADEFDELTRFEIGRASMTPQEALQKIKDGGGFSLDIVNGLFKIFPESNAKKAS